MKKLIALIGLAALAGCDGPPPKPLTNAEVVAQADAKSGYDLDLPENATNVKKIGERGWHTFDLEVDGVKRRFLRHYHWGDAGTESMVEITPR